MLCLKCVKMKLIGKKMGEVGQKGVKKFYEIKSVMSNYLDVYEDGSPMAGIWVRIKEIIFP